VEYLWFGLCSIADMGGTNITQIEGTYYHLNDTICLANAVADYRMDSARLRKMREDVGAAKLRLLRQHLLQSTEKNILLYVVTFLPT
jgi:hypothetical protein